MHHKRKKTKRRVRCTICTEHRWRGNGAGRWDHKTNKRKLSANEQEYR